MGKSEKKDKKVDKVIEKKEKKEKKEKEKLDKKEKKSKKEKKEHSKEKKDKKEKKKDKKDKKEKKDKKRKHSESESEEEFVIHKKNKVADPVVESKPQATTESTAGWNDWNKASFDGDDQKKNKFLRLLGAKKSAPAATQAFVPAKKSGGGLYGGLKSAIDEDEKQRISNDLEKQFDHGLQFRKQMQMGRRGGLGFN